MKNKVILFLAVSAIATLSFSFVSNEDQAKEKSNPVQHEVPTPVGGFALDDAI